MMKADEQDATIESRCVWQWTPAVVVLAKRHYGLMGGQESAQDQEVQLAGRNLTRDPGRWPVLPGRPDSKARDRRHEMSAAKNRRLTYRTRAGTAETDSPREIALGALETEIGPAAAMDRARRKRSWARARQGWG